MTTWEKLVALVKQDPEHNPAILACKEIILPRSSECPPLRAIFSPRKNHPNRITISFKLSPKMEIFENGGDLGVEDFSCSRRMTKSFFDVLYNNIEDMMLY